MNRELHSIYGDGDTPQRDGLDPVLLEVAVALRAPVEPSDDFAERVMSAVRQPAPEGVIDFTPWWRRRSIRLTPVATTLLAAGLAFAAYLGGRAADSDDAAPAQAAAPELQRTQLVRFVFVDPSAREVTVVGTFNQWRKDATPLRETGVPGVWSVSVPLGTGMHEYAFVIDGEHWAADPFAPAVTDEFGTESSIVRVQAPTSS